MINFESLGYQKILPITIVFISIGFFVNSKNQLVVVIDKINQTLITILVFCYLPSIIPIIMLFKIRRTSIKSSGYLVNAPLKYLTTILLQF